MFIYLQATTTCQFSSRHYWCICWYATVTVAGSAAEPSSLSFETWHSYSDGDSLNVVCGRWWCSTMTVCCPSPVGVIQTSGITNCYRRWVPVLAVMELHHIGGVLCLVDWLLCYAIKSTSSHFHTVHVDSLRVKQETTLEVHITTLVLLTSNHHRLVIPAMCCKLHHLLSRILLYSYWMLVFAVCIALPTQFHLSSKMM